MRFRAECAAAVTGDGVEGGAFVGVEDAPVAVGYSFLVDVEEAWARGCWLGVLWVGWGCVIG